MSLFHRSSRSELPETVLNEAAAMNTEAAPAEGPPAAPETEEAAAAPLPAREAGLTGSDAVCARPDPEAEQRWQEAARSVAGHWPQIKDDLPALLGRMKAISERYGDPALWQ
ncbi:MAG: hypothetical protein IK116_08175, partial [Firmicutes bacterium]|nr:hypothetical protein [Bacillota bacterium]